MIDCAVFFDRDGIVNERLIGDYVKSINEFIFNEDFFGTMKITKSLGFLSFLITNQQGIGKKIMTFADLGEIHNFMNQKLVEKSGCTFNEIFVCGSLNSDNDPRRKPNPGMILEAIEKYGLNPQKCIMVGDSESDILAGYNAGTNTIFIGDLSGNLSVEPTFSFQTLRELNFNLQSILEELKERI